MTPRLAVAIEAGRRRTFAVAIDWPGWSRAGRTEEDAVATLLAYAERYRAVLGTRGLPGFPSARDADAWQVAVVERLDGDAGTDFGVPSRPPAADAEVLTPSGAAPMLSILEAAWTVFDAAVEAARGHDLRVGPRGGGRDLGKIVAHAREADASYLHQLGARGPRLPGPTGADVERAVRERAAEVVVALAEGRPIEDANQVRRPWTPRSYMRRAAWHALDHAWELDDRRID